MQGPKTLRSFTAIFWLGFFMAISFMEAPLKFTVPGISMAQGVMIGRVIFSALNKIEWLFFIVILAACFFSRPTFLLTVLIGIAGFILLLETSWVLPLLDINAKKLIAGQKTSGNTMHYIYGFLEILKIPVLILIGLQDLGRKQFQR